jgi:hypothetical protein
LKFIQRRRGGRQKLNLLGKFFKKSPTFPNGHQALLKQSRNPSVSFTDSNPQCPIPYNRTFHSVPGLNCSYFYVIPQTHAIPGISPLESADSRRCQQVRQIAKTPWQIPSGPIASAILRHSRSCSSHVEGLAGRWALFSTPALCGAWGLL